MSNDKKWTWDEYPSDGTYFILRSDRRVFVHSLTESQAKEICDKFNALASATSRIAELEARVEQLERAIKASRGTLGYGDLQTEPETILKVRTILDSALLTPPQNTKGDD